MTPRHMAERRALYAAIDASSDRHIRPANVEPLLAWSPRSTVCLYRDALWVREPQGAHWRVYDVGPRSTCTSDRHAVVDDFGYLVEVPA